MAENKEKAEIQIIQNKEAEFALTPVGQTIKKFEVVQGMATMYSKSTIVPDIYKGNIGNCAIALDIAERMNANALMVIQNLYIVHGSPSFSSWKGSPSFKESIVAWMPIPEIKKGEQS